jgi:hypothetical protein
MTPLEKKRSIEDPASARMRRFVVNLGPLSAKTNSSGVSSRQRAKLSAFCEP